MRKALAAPAGYELLRAALVASLAGVGALPALAQEPAAPGAVIESPPPATPGAPPPAPCAAVNAQNASSLLQVVAEVRRQRTSSLGVMLKLGMVENQLRRLRTGAENDLTGTDCSGTAAQIETQRGQLARLVPGAGEAAAAPGFAPAQPPARPAAPSPAPAPAFPAPPAPRPAPDGDQSGYLDCMASNRKAFSQLERDARQLQDSGRLDARQRAYVEQLVNDDREWLRRVFIPIQCGQLADKLALDQLQLRRLAAAPPAAAAPSPVATVPQAPRPVPAATAAAVPSHPQPQPAPQPFAATAPHAVPAHLPLAAAAPRPQQPPAPAKPAAPPPAPAAAPRPQNSGAKADPRKCHPLQNKSKADPEAACKNT
jgi:hypothetical protein